MKFTVISDTHLSEPILDGGDVLLHCGDLTYRGDLHETCKALNYLQEQRDKYKYVIFIAGNHDWLFQKEPDIARNLARERDLIYLEDSGVVLGPKGWYQWDGSPKEGIKIYGAPHQPSFCNWAFNLPRGPELARKWSLIPEGTDILITHGPPYGILDRAPRGYPQEDWTEQDFYFHSEAVGCKDLWERIKVVKPKLHCFGHIHASYGRLDNEPTTGTTFINAAIMDEGYNPEHKPIVFEL